MIEWYKKHQPMQKLRLPDWTTLPYPEETGGGCVYTDVENITFHNNDFLVALFLIVF